MTLSILIFYFFAVISLLQAHTPLLGIPYLILWGSGIMAYFLVKGIPPLKVFTATTLSVFPITLLGICQYYNVSFQEYLKNLPEWTWILSPETVPQLTAPASTFSNKNCFSHAIAIMAPLVIGYVYLSKKYWKLLGIIALGLIAYCLWLTGTRSALLAFSMALIVLIVKLMLRLAKNFKTRQARQFFILSCLFCVVLWGYLLGVPAKLSQVYERGGTAKLRQAWALNTMIMIKDHPFGVGLGNWKVNYPKYNHAVRKDWSFSSIKQANRCHNEIIQVCAELGIQGWLAFVAMFIIFFKRKPSLFVGLAMVSCIIVLSLSFGLERSIVVLYFFMLFGISNENHA